MTEPNLALFQAAATAIPTMLIAIAVGMGRGRAMANGYSEAPLVQRAIRMSMTLLLAVVIGTAEINALLAVGRGFGTREQAYWVMLGVVLALFSVVSELVMPMIALEENINKKVGVVLNAILIALAITAMYFGTKEYVPFSP